MPSIQKNSDLFSACTDYLFEYGHQGARWGIQIRATDPEDAHERLRALAFAQFRGEVVAKISVPSFKSVRPHFKALLRLLSQRH